ncbi:hypothetical protein DINM_021146 [Dirofilaria immitis]|nr:hypothetical protein [Dirofilaria immitis]
MLHLPNCHTLCTGVQLLEKGDLIQEASGYLCEKLNFSGVGSPKTWLSTIYALAACDKLSPELGQTVLQPSFVANLLEGLVDFRKLMAVTTIAQVQHFLKVISSKACHGPSVDIFDLMQFSSTIVNDMALKLRYGKSEERNVRNFHSLLHKLVPVNSHAFPPALTEDGIFVNAVIKLDVRENRFIPLNRFEETRVPRLACDDDDKRTLMGPLLLNIRLLKARGFIPVLFSQDDFDSNTSLKQQFTRIKTKLEEASDDTKVDDDYSLFRFLSAFENVDRENHDEILILSDFIMGYNNIAVNTE